MTTEQPLITKEFLSFVMTDTFPGCKLRKHDRMGGITMSMTIWHYSVDMALTTKPVSLADKLGELVMTLTYLPKELKAEKSSATIILRRINTTDPDRVKQFVEGVRAYMKGIVAAITTAVSQPGYREANIFDGEEDDD